MIGVNIKKYRMAKGMTLTELAERSNVSKSYLNNLERNKKNNPSINVLFRLSKELNVDIYQIIGVTKGVDHSHDISQDWLVFIEEVKRAGIEKQSLSEYKEVIEYIKWRNRERRAL